MDASTYFRIEKMRPQLQVTDIERSIAFYTKELGFAVEFRYEDFYAGIIKDGCSIHLKATWHPVEERKNNQDLDLLFSVGEIESVYEEIGKKSVEITQTLRSMPYGKEFYIADPDGHIIAFFAEG
mgnify:CR=1 FL=1